MLKLDPLEGKVLGQLTVVARAADSKYGRKRYFVRCTCGQEKLLYGSELIRKLPKRSCGCRGQAMHRSWTDEEVDFVRREWPVRGRLIAAELNRTIASVRHMAARLCLENPKIKRNPKGAWPEAEEEILRRLYPVGGTAACLPHLPGRSKEAIRHRASQLEIRCPSNRRGNAWKPEEIDVLERLYLKRGWQAVQKELPHRNENAIKSKAVELGMLQPAAWTEEQDDRIRRTFPTSGARGCQKYMRTRTLSAIQSRAQFLGVKAKPAWSERELSVVRRFFPTEGPKGTQERLRERRLGMTKSVQAIGHQAYKMGLRYHNKGAWTEAEIALLRERYSELGGDGLAPLMPGRTPTAIRVRARHLGVRVLQSWTKNDVRVLRKHYVAEGSAAVHKLLPHHSRESIRTKAAKLGLVRYQTERGLARRVANLDALPAGNVVQINRGSNPIEVCPAERRVAAA